MSGNIISGLLFILLSFIVAYDLYKNKVRPFESNNYKLYGVLIIGLCIGIYFIFYFD